MQPFSVLIIVKGRASHLKNVLAGISQATHQPAEIIIAHMNEPTTQLKALNNIELKQIVVTADNPLPLAEARNAAAATARNSILVFLDVDCIPAPDCFEQLLHDLKSADIAMADPHYLQTPVTQLNYKQLEQDAKPSAARASLSFGPTDNYALFWSLGFAISAASFQKLGGFDEAYAGYGGEDTDFAFSAREAGLSLTYSKARVYHQPHESHDPPYDKLSDIAQNATVFYRKWGIWPMEGWLKQFAAEGYIEWHDDHISVIKLPAH